MPRSAQTRRTLVLAVAVLASAYPIFRLINISLANFLTNGELFVAACYTTVLIVTLVENRFAWLAAFLIVPHAALFGHVNPIDRGLRVFESAPLFRVVQGSPDLLRHRWIVYSESVAATGFFSAVGCEVVNGLKYVPDLKTLSVFDPTGAQHNLINRSMWLLAEPEYGEPSCGVRAAAAQPGEVEGEPAGPCPPQHRRALRRVHDPAAPGRRRQAPADPHGARQRVLVIRAALVLPEGLRPSDSPTRSLARRYAGALRSRGSLARSLAAQVSWFLRWLLGL